MNDDRENELASLRQENELLILQLKQLQQEYERFLGSATNTNDTRNEARSRTQTQLAAGDEYGFVGEILPSADTLALVKYVLQSEPHRQMLPPSLKEVVCADPAFLEQVARAERAEAALRAMNESSASIVTGQNKLEEKLENFGELLESITETSHSTDIRLSELGKLLPTKIQRHITNDRDATDARLASVEKKVLEKIDSETEAQVSSFNASFQSYFTQLERSVLDLKSTYSKEIEEVITQLALTQSEAIKAVDFDAQIDRLSASIDEMSQSVNEQALLPLNMAQAQIQALREDLSNALKTQSIRDHDLKDLQARFARLGETKREQEAVLLELREKLGTASTFLKSLREGSEPDDQARSADELVTLLAGKTQPQSSE